MPQVKIFVEDHLINQLPSLLNMISIKGASVLEADLTDEQIAELKEHLEAQAKEGKGDGAVLIPIRNFQS